MAQQSHLEMASLRSTHDHSEGLSVRAEDPAERLDRMGGPGPGP